MFPQQTRQADCLGVACGWLKLCATGLSKRSADGENRKSWQRKNARCLQKRANLGHLGSSGVFLNVLNSSQKYPNGQELTYLALRSSIERQPTRANWSVLSVKLLCAASPHNSKNPARTAAFRRAMRFVLVSSFDCSKSECRPLASHHSPRSVFRPPNSARVPNSCQAGFTTLAQASTVSQTETHLWCDRSVCAKFEANSDR